VEGRRLGSPAWPGLPNPQPSHEPPMPVPQQAPITSKPDGSVEKKSAEKMSLIQQALHHELKKNKCRPL